jgi:hypothetical protein
MFVSEIKGMEMIHRNPMQISIHPRTRNRSFLKSINLEKRNPPIVRPNKKVVSIMAKEWMLLSTKYFRIRNQSTS